MEASELLEGAQWEAARDAFEQELREAETPDARDGLGMAVWFLGGIEEGVAMRERAFDGFVAAGRCDEAARAAAWISHQYMLRGRVSAARGWLARADRALVDDDCEGRGWVTVERARHAERLEECAEHARRAMEIARATDAGDLEVFALSLLGQVEVRAGRVTDGMALLEEAMAAASAGRVRNVHTLAEAYCNLITASTSAGDWERAAEWCELVDEFARDRGVMPLFGACRTIHADVLVARGRWPEAEQALENALETHARFMPEMGAPTVATMAELRIRQGRLAEAEQLLGGREEHPSALRALAHLRIADGQPQVAAALLERGLARSRATRSRRPNCSPCSSTRAWRAGTQTGRQTRRRGSPSWPRSRGSGWPRRGRSSPPRRLGLAAGRPADAAEPARARSPTSPAWRCRVDVGEARLELARALAAEQPALARGGGARRLRGLPRAGRFAGDGRRRRGAARAGDRDRSAATHRRRADRARGGRCSSC